MQFNNRDDIIQMTSYWTGERFQDGRPRVSDSVLERLRNMSIEEVWRLAWMKLNNYQFQGEFKCTHNTQKPTVGRAVTATFVPIREDLELAMMRQAKSQGMKGMYNQWVVDGLVEDDVFVADLFDKTEYGTLGRRQSCHRDPPEDEARRRRRMGQHPRSAADPRD